MRVLLSLALLAVSLHAQPPAAATGSGPEKSQGWYRLQSGDSIEVRFFYNEELNESVMIRPDGYISMPLVGELKVEDNTISELETSLSEAYKNIVRKPDLTIQVRGYANRKVYVGGEVRSPGVLELSGRQTVLSAIMQSGGLLMSSNRGEALVVRRGEDGSPSTTVVSLKQEPGKLPLASGFDLQPFDVVLVDRSWVAKANQAIDQYIKKMIPVDLSAGFLYVLNNPTGGLAVTP